MERFVTRNLIKWKDSKSHLPLIVRGARQTGKTFTIEEFGKRYFSSLVTINFEFEFSFSKCFTNLDPKIIVRELELLSGKQIVPGKTLLFLDEIQECPRAILSLRYFKEKMPKLHIICAGSLLEFTLNSKNFRMPVGRIEFLYMYPMSFSEFLMGLREQQLFEYLPEVKIGNISDAVHNKALELFRIYIITGGMPAVVKEYCENFSLLNIARSQSIISNGYSNDFGKYGSKAEIQYLQKIYSQIGVLATRPIKYSKIDPDTQSRDLKKAIDILVMAGVFFKIHQNSGAGIPLQSEEKKKYKLLFLDTGLYLNKLNLDYKKLNIKKDINMINRGTVAEHIVGQELLSLQESFKPGYLSYWQREARNSSAEVDYLIQYGEKIIPIEVKAGHTGRLKSLRIFMDEKNAPFGIRISQSSLSFENRVLSIPFYLISNINKYISELL